MTAVSNPFSHKLALFYQARQLQSALRPVCLRVRSAWWRVSSVMSQNAATLRLMSDLREMQKDAPEVPLTATGTWLRNRFLDSGQRTDSCIIWTIAETSVWMLGGKRSAAQRREHFCLGGHNFWSGRHAMGRRHL